MGFCAALRKEYPWFRSRRIKYFIVAILCGIVCFCLLYKEQGSRKHKAEATDGAEHNDLLLHSSIYNGLNKMATVFSNPIKFRQPGKTKKVYRQREDILAKDSRGLTVESLQSYQVDPDSSGYFKNAPTDKSSISKPIHASANTASTAKTAISANPNKITHGNIKTINQQLNAMKRHETISMPAEKNQNKPSRPPAGRAGTSDFTRSQTKIAGKDLPNIEAAAKTSARSFKEKIPKLTKQISNRAAKTGKMIIDIPNGSLKSRLKIQATKPSTKHPDPITNRQRKSGTNPTPSLHTTPSTSNSGRIPNRSTKPVTKHLMLISQAATPDTKHNANQVITKPRTTHPILSWPTTTAGTKHQDPKLNGPIIPGTKRPMPSKATKPDIKHPKREHLKPISKERLACPNFLNKNEVLYGRCQPHVSSKEACNVAKRLYKLDPSLLKCKQKGHGNMCAIMMLKERNTNNNRTYKVDCKRARNICKEGYFDVLVMGAENGLMRKESTYSTVNQLEQELPGIIDKNIARKLYFVVLHCTLKADETQKKSQLLTFDPRMTLQQTPKPRDKGLININILLLDSVSRAHFYRSLPKTIELFRKWDKDPAHAPARVFDFELFQAVEGHTAENTHAMFTGKLFPEALRTARVPVDAGYLFGTFSRLGYQTMWQEDLCWRGIWGLMLDMVANNFKQLAEKLTKNFIDHTGITHSSCEMLRVYGLTTPFSGPPGDQICYNGEFQMSYFLNYTTDTIKAIESDKYARPLLSYMSSSVGHDHRAIRTQTVDPQLVQYVSDLANSDNTISIILADHGNTYAEYTISILEGRFEMFHPSLFILVPNKVAQLLGDEAMRALSTNQHRLVTVIDLHHTFMALATPLKGRVAARGLFTPISADKTCDDVELRTPNLCVCDGWDSPTTNDTLKMSIAEFAIGELNNMIEDQQHTIATFDATKRSCQRLIIKRFQNVRERHNSIDGSLITAMDIYVAAGNVAPQVEDLFHVEVKSVEVPKQPSLDMRLLQFDRLSMFGSYRVCADKGVNLKLCVCSSKPNITSGFLAFEQPHKLEHKLFVHLEECITLWQRNHSKDAFAYDVTNHCWGAEYVLSVDASYNNIRFSRTLPFKVAIKPGRRTFILSARKYYAFWNCKLILDVRVAEIFKKQRTIR